MNESGDPKHTESKKSIDFGDEQEGLSTPFKWEEVDAQSVLVTAWVLGGAAFFLFLSIVILALGGRVIDQDNAVQIFDTTTELVKIVVLLITGWWFRDNMVKKRKQ